MGREQGVSGRPLATGALRIKIPAAGARDILSRPTVRFKAWLAKGNQGTPSLSLPPYSAGIPYGVWRHKWFGPHHTHYAPPVRPL